VINKHNTLCGLFCDIEKRIKMETLNDDYNNWCDTQLPTSNTSTSINRFFKNVDETLSKYLHPELLTLQQQQIQDSFLYDAEQLFNFQVTTLMKN